MKNQSPSAIGIDIAKDKFDAVHLPSNEHAVFENNKDGFKEFIRWAKKHKPQTIVCEATGGYQNEFVRALIKANLPIHTANPGRIKHYIASLGTKAKTDKSDAVYIAHYALERKPEPQKNRGETHTKLKEYLAARRQLVEAKKRLKCQIKHFDDKQLVRSMRTAIEQIESQIEKITKVIFGLLDREPAMKEQFDVLITMPGIGKIVAITLLVDCPELSEISAEKVAVLAGVVPFANDSGAKSGKRSIFGGRAVVRSALFVAAMVVTKMKLPNKLKEYYEKLLAKGKVKMVALVALAHKMLNIACSMVKNKQKWNQTQKNA